MNIHPWGCSLARVVELLDSCSSIEPSTPASTAATNSLLTSTPNTNKPSTQSSPNSIHLSQPIAPSPASTPTSSTSSLCSKRKALFSQEDSGRISRSEISCLLTDSTWLAEIACSTVIDLLQQRKQDCLIICPFQIGFLSQWSKLVLPTKCYL